MLNRVPLADTNGRWAGHDVLQTCPLPSFIFLHANLCRIFLIYLLGSLQFSAMNVSVRATMKGAAKCDKHCELQNSVSRQGPERILCFWDNPKSMPALVFVVIPMMILS